MGPTPSASPAVFSPLHEVQYDVGTHARARLGFIVMATDLVMEENIFRLTNLAPGVGPSITRIPSPNHIDLAGLEKHIDKMAEAASLLQPDAAPDVICYACTSGSIVLTEERVTNEILRGAPPCTAATTLVTGVVNALRRLNATKIVVATPYLDEINTLELQSRPDKHVKWKRNSLLTLSLPPD